MQSYISVRGALQIGPFIQYVKPYVNQDEEIDMKICVLLQSNSYIHTVDYPYRMESLVRVPNCMYCRYIGPEEKLKFAYAIYGYGSIPVGLAAAISRQPYLVRAAISTIGDKGLNGISLGDNCDEWYRVAAYKLAWLSLI